MADIGSIAPTPTGSHWATGVRLGQQPTTGPEASDATQGTTPPAPTPPHTTPATLPPIPIPPPLVHYEDVFKQKVGTLLSNKVTEAGNHPTRVTVLARVSKTLMDNGINGYQYVTRQVPGFSSFWQHTFPCKHRFCAGGLSCSESTKLAIREHGPLWGATWSVLRQASCMPGVDAEHPITQLMIEPLSFKDFTAKFAALRKQYPRLRDWLPNNLPPERAEVNRRLRYANNRELDARYGHWPPKFVKDALAKHLGFVWEKEMDTPPTPFPPEQEKWIQTRIAEIEKRKQATQMRREALVGMGVLKYDY